MVNTKIRLIIFFAAKDGAKDTISKKNKTKTNKQKKQNQEQTVAQIINFLLPNSDLN